MNFWPRGTFIPAVAAALPFTAIPPHFNNPAWDVPQPVVANPLFGPGIAAITPWSTSSSTDNIPQLRESDEKNAKGDVSPWLHHRNEQDSSKSSRSSSSRTDERRKSKDRSRRRRSRTRSRSRSHDRRSRDRSDSPADRRSRARSRDRRDSRWARDDYRRDSDYDKRDGGESKKREKDDHKDSARLSCGDDNKYSLESANYKMQTPNETIMIRGLAQHISENDIRQDIVQCGLRPKDIRLIRKKETGVSRGFAFVEFNTTEEALCWMELKQGVLMLQDMYRAIMQFSIVAGDPGSSSPTMPIADWDCPKCYAHNFKKRVTCYKCLAVRPTSDPKHPNSEISPHPTTKIIIRNLDPLTTEEDLLNEISAISKISIQTCQISRDALTNLSRGVCYLEMKNVLEAIILYNELTAQSLTILNKKVFVGYCKLHRDPPTHERSSELAQPQAYSMSDVPKLAEYSARLYATNPSQKAALIQYYTQYYTDQINQISSSEGQSTDINSAAAVALSAMQMAQAKKAVLAGAAASAVSAGAALNNAPQISAPSTTSYGYISSQQLIGNTAIGEPDITSYTYEESSGYYYDQKTGLYYDPNTKYYYHSQDQVYLYWDTIKKAYMPASGVTNNSAKIDDSRDDKKNRKDDKDKEKSQDKVKVAKRIAKDMERWAKSQNQRKDFARQSQMALQQSQNAAKAAATADIAFDVLERQEAGSYDVTRNSSEDQAALVAAYGGGSDSDEGGDEVASYEHHHTDWVKMACLLCKRQLPSTEALQKHNQLSDLHKQNLQAWFTSRGVEMPPERSSDPSSLSYRDRARERRLKFGTPDAPKQNKIKEKFLKTQQPVYEEPTRAGIPAANLGSKMLQKMGWSEGMGLGKMNQGRTDIVHAVQRVSTAGLGVAGSSLGSGGPGNSYKDNVKRAAMARFSELQEREPL